MSRKATKAQGNVFYQARIAASTYNDRFSSRAGAAEELGLDQTRLTRIELNLLKPYPEEVAIMADGYNAPELIPYFCATECPLGQGGVRLAVCPQLDRVGIAAMAALQNAAEIQAKLLDVVRDGRITPDEIPQLEEIMAFLKGAADAYTQMKVWVEKNLK